MPDIYSIFTLICRTRITPPSPFKKGEAVSALSCSRNYDLFSIAMRVFRVRATRRSGTAELKRPTPLSVELTSTGFGERLIFLPFQKPLHLMPCRLRRPALAHCTRKRWVRFYPNPARPRSGPYDIFGHPSWPKEASLWGERVLSEAKGRVYAGERTWP